MKDYLLIDKPQNMVLTGKLEETALVSLIEILKKNYIVAVMDCEEFMSIVLREKKG